MWTAILRDIELPERKRLESRILTHDLVELATAYALILAAIWTLNPWQRIFYWTAVAWIIVTTYIHRPTWRTLGLGLPGLLRSIWVIAAAGLVAVAAA
jgi:hypothetical protein